MAGLKFCNRKLSNFHQKKKGIAAFMICYFFYWSDAISRLISECEIKSNIRSESSLLLNESII